MKKYLLILSLPFILAACCQPCQEEAKSDIIGQQNIKLESDIMTPESMWAMGRVSEIQVSPGDSLILFGVTWYDWKQNKGNRELFTMKPDGSNRKNITNTNAGEYNAVWNCKGEILFMTAN
ncbi:MAG TPA: peptidase S9, partial [Bacteroidales bacterium]|nr:peptidase S9 [Bacteroidales bacterium]